MVAARRAAAGWVMSRERRMARTGFLLAWRVVMPMPRSEPTLTWVVLMCCRWQVAVDI